MASELSSVEPYNEIAMLRVFYWAAYYGKDNFINGYMILLLKWSPFMKSFQKQSVLTAAIRGKQVEVIRKMANFHFTTGAQTKHSVRLLEDWVVENWYGKDVDDNNPLHYAYLNDMPDIRQILRQSDLMHGEAALTVQESKKQPGHKQKQFVVPSKRMNRKS